jgi:hypothetical protein
MLWNLTDGCGGRGFAPPSKTGADLNLPSDEWTEVFG